MSHEADLGQASRRKDQKVREDQVRPPRGTSVRVDVQSYQQSDRRRGQTAEVRWEELECLSRWHSLT